MEMVAREILRCSGMVEQMIHRLNHAIERQDLRRVDSILRQAVVVRKLYDNIVSYLSSLLSSGSMTEEQATQTAGMMYILSDIERTDTLCTEATESLQSILEKKHKLSPEAVEDLCRGLADREKICIRMCWKLFGQVMARMRGRSFIKRITCWI